MEKLEYEFIELPLGGTFSANPKVDYQKIIQEKGREGWRLVQIFAPTVTGNGVPKGYEMIFVRPVQ